MPHLFKNAGIIVQLQGINISLDMRKHLVLILVSSYLLSKVHIGISVEMVIDRNSKVIHLDHFLYNLLTDKVAIYFDGAHAGSPYSGATKHTECIYTFFGKSFNKKGNVLLDIGLNPISKGFIEA